MAQSSIPDPHNLRIKAIHNGTVVQDGSTKEMIFGVADMIAFLSQGTTLERGSLIMTGTPPGIGAMRYVGFLFRFRTLAFVFLSLDPGILFDP